jgi:hypothetical protein
LNAVILISWLPVTLGSSIIILCEILVRVSIFIIVIFFFLLMLLSYVFWGTINLFKSLIAYCSIYRHLATSTWRAIYNTLLIRLTSSTGTFVSCCVSVKMAIVSTSFISLTGFKVIFSGF